ncbi:beta-ketoacyl synthase N-terminal-like domain-containing protein [Streptomyces sp. NEAU-Y11]|uniref:beta-ketoacyl synthase N-terminal-like domain-containing protein n=1 Tax=Streptomyces cucumeris TaxID=2962890 RepID=UPI0020C906EC|nr:beta-ketoacyl synthase N-terminal-like domain-containing protein [Streptomyces sp. NEAU-Y11]MCP9206882.1 3-oxoacyl-ACP synthase [Streptomyces sp. NEAU-Y11]
MTGTAITGTGVVLPGIGDPAGLLRGAVAGAGPVCPAELIGKKGLRFKDRATQLGLCAADAALRDAGLLGPHGLRVPGGRVGVVVSSNLGNADTVCRAVETIARETTAALSAMDTPNASSNIIASETAIRFVLRGPNLSVCNGVTSGLDALRWARLTLRSGRADHMLVIGVEPDNEITRRLAGGPVVDGGAAVVVSRTDAEGSTDAVGGAAPRLLLGPVVRTAELRDAAARLTAAAPDGGGGLWLCPDPALVPSGAETAGLTDWGECSGALGLLQCAAAVGWADAGRTGPVHALLGGAGAEATATVFRPAVRPVLPAEAPAEAPDEAPATPPAGPLTRHAPHPALPVEEPA